MGLKTIDLNCGSAIKCEASLGEDGSVLLLRFAGTYRRGSEGNGDGLFMCAMAAAYYDITEPASIVLDFAELRYEWGNTISRTLNFFWEHGRDDDERNRQVVVIATGETLDALRALDKTINSGVRSFADSLEVGIANAQQAASAYLA